MDTPEHQTKYHKLAAEYSKVRAQNQVLKKVVLEEQQKALKHSELLQALRKAEQENDSLNFRNQQLTCRLTLLQDDLHQLQHGSGKSGKKGHSSGGSSNGSGNSGGGKGGGGGDDNSSLHSSGGCSTDGVDVEVLMQELQAKIAENASLHARVSELERSHFQEQQQQTAVLQQQNRELSTQHRESLEALEQQERTAKSKIEQLEQERLAAEVSTQQQRRHIARLKQQLVDAKLSPPPTPARSPLAANSCLASRTGRDSGAKACVEGSDVSLGLTTATLESPTSVSSSSSYVSVAPCASLRLDLPLGGGVQSPTAVVEEEGELPSVPTLSRELCVKFAAFITVYCEVRKEKVVVGATDGEGGGGGGGGGDTKALETINKVLQGVDYWHKLGPLLEDVMAKTVGPPVVSGNAHDGSSGTSSSTSTTNTLTGGKSVVGSVSTVTASTLAHLRVLSSVSAPSAAFQSSLRSIQSAWSAVLPYLSALSANSCRSHSPTTLLRLLGLLADRCFGLHTATADALERWLIQDGVEDDDPVSLGLRELGRVTDTLVTSLRRSLETGLGSDQKLLPLGAVTGLARDQSVARGLAQHHSGSSSSAVGGGGDERSPHPHHAALPPSSSSPSSPTSLSSPDESSHLSSASSTNNTVEAGHAARLAQLHRQREHWRLEYHLLAHKHSKLMKIFNDRKEVGCDSALGGEGKDATVAGGADAVAGGCSVLRTSILGEVVLGRGGHSGWCPAVEGGGDQEDRRKKSKKDEVWTGDVSSSSPSPEAWRESMIRHHLNSRLSKLYLDFTESCSRVRLFEDECEAALRRLANSEEQRGAVEAELETVRREKTRLAEELRTTCTNYEEQISTMSEHLADVNERMARQEDVLSRGGVGGGGGERRKGKR